MVHLWLYTSRAVIAPRSIEAGGIYLAARANNRRLGVTGHLHREGDRFVQVLEGGAAAVAMLRARISRDWRHEAITTLHSGTAPTRRFEGWDMALTDAEMDVLPPLHAGASLLSALTTAQPEELMDRLAACLSAPARPS